MFGTDDSKPGVFNTTLLFALLYYKDVRTTKGGWVVTKHSLPGGDYYKSDVFGLRTTRPDRVRYWARTSSPPCPPLGGQHQIVSYMVYNIVQS